MPTHEHQQLRRLPDAHLKNAPNAAPSGDPARQVVAEAAVLGSKTVEVLVTDNLVTHGPKASWRAKNEERGGSQLGPDKQIVLNSQTLLMTLGCATPKYSSRLPKPLRSRRPLSQHQCQKPSLQLPLQPTPAPRP